MARRSAKSSFNARYSTAAAGAAAEYAEFGAVRMVERNGARGSLQRRSEVESRVVGQERTGDDARPRRTLELHDHAGGGAHYVVGRLAEDAPAGFGDLRHVGGRIHLRKHR